MTEEKPPKRRTSFGPEEPSVRSLKTELEFMQKRQVATAREHCIIHNRYTKNMEKAEKETRALKKARFDLAEKLTRTEDARSILALEVQHRNEELTRLRGIEKRAEELEAALAVSPDANIRLKVKHLIAKWHPDKHATAVPLDNETVTRDLVELLE